MQKKSLLKFKFLLQNSFMKCFNFRCSQFEEILVQTCYFTANILSRAGQALAGPLDP